MSKEKKTVELKDEELEKVSGGRLGFTCPRGYTNPSEACKNPWCEYITPNNEAGYTCSKTCANFENSPKFGQK